MDNSDKPVSIRNQTIWAFIFPAWAYASIERLTKGFLYGFIIFAIGFPIIMGVSELAQGAIEYYFYFPLIVISYAFHIHWIRKWSKEWNKKFEGDSTQIW